MRFTAAGPDFPDDLLLARDQGRVVLFCGAGVSLARAGLPSFFALANQVIEALGASQESAAFRLMSEAREFDKRTGLAGIISADRIFGLLEREFLPKDIEAAVAQALRPREPCDLTAHQILLKLATSQTGQVRLVTTNFDRLFSDCASSIQSWHPPRLPDPSRAAEFSGVVYLHGRASSDYTHAENEGFILSSAEFGRAYLADGWATDFIRNVLHRYVVLFVGYSADDPPVQYLLEALNRANSSLQSAYALQSGSESDATAKWQHKGVRAIPYSSADSHAALWESLQLWAERASDPKLWRQRLIETAKLGPETLEPHIRGQVAHLVSTVDGAREFADGGPPPATWLCVFDPSRRYAQAGREQPRSKDSPVVDPHSLYGLDTDPPKPTRPDRGQSGEDVPKGAWDAFLPNKHDWVGLEQAHVAAFRGHFAKHHPILLPRLRNLGQWLARVFNQPVAVWWAAQQYQLHPDILTQIQWELEHSELECAGDIRIAWDALMRSERKASQASFRDWTQLRSNIEKMGWSDSILNDYVASRRPYLTVERSFWNAPSPPPADASPELSQLLRRDVEYPRFEEQIEVPQAWLHPLVRALGLNLEFARNLEQSIGGYGLYSIAPIAPDPHVDRSYDRTFGLSAAILEYCEFFERLASNDPDAAIAELQAWPPNDGTVFSRLRIWASRLASSLPKLLREELIVKLDDTAFWRADHQRDLLIAISSQWSAFGERVRAAVESRILSGPAKRDSETIVEHEERAAFASLTRIQWLRDKGCELKGISQAAVALLRKRAPKWRSEFSDSAADLLESRGGWVSTNTEYQSLLDVPIVSILDRAKNCTPRGINVLVEDDPFGGAGS